MLGEGKAIVSDDLFGAPAGWYPDPLGLPQLRWWNNHAWTEQTSAARQPMVVQDTKFAWADDEYPSRRDERLRESSSNREPAEPIVPTADALRELEPPRAFTQVSQGAPTVPSAPFVPVQPTTPYVPPQQPAANPAAAAAAGPEFAAETRAAAEAMFGGESVFGADNYFSTAPGAPAAPAAPAAEQPFTAQPAAADPFAADPFAAQPAAAEPVAPKVESLYQPDPVVEAPIGNPLGNPLGSSVSFDSLFDARPVNAPAESLDALFGQTQTRRAGTRVKTPVVTADHVASTSTRTAKVSNTAPAWIIAMIPLFQLVVSLLLLTSLGMNGSQFIYIGILVVPYLLAILLAYVDRKILLDSGHDGAAHWGWAALTAPVYLLMRARSVLRETGHGFGPVLVWLGLGVLHLASVVAVPGVLIALVPSVFTAQIESKITSDAWLIANSTMTVQCEGNAPVLPGETMVCQSVDAAGNSFDITVSLVRSNGWISWQVVDWGSFSGK